MFTHIKYKQGFITLHRYLGLATALFLIVAGITGSVLAYYHELDEWLNPDLFFTKEQDQQFLSEPTLFSVAQQYVLQHSNNINSGSINTMPLEFEAGRSLMFRVNNNPNYNQLFVSPYTGEILGHRTWGDLTQGSDNLAGFIYRLHYSLWIPNNWGILLLGIIAFIWTLDCFIALGTTLPVAKKFNLNNFLKRWKQSFKMRWKSKGYSFHFLLHRAAGLWLWGMLFIFAWSSVAFNLPEIYKPVTNFVFEKAPANPATKPQNSVLPLNQALALSRVYAEALAIEKGIEAGSKIDSEAGTRIKGERSLRYLANSNTFQYRFHSSLDVDDSLSRSVLYIDASNGKLLQVFWPTSQYSATTVTQWLYALHMGEVFGWPYQLFVCLLGLAVCYFSYSGLVIWWKKQHKRKLISNGESRSIT